MAAGSTIEWTQATWNPTTGCARMSAGCDNCLAPDTPVLMADMTWRPIGTVKAGDDVIAFTEEPELGQNRLFEVSTVEAVWTTEKPAVEINIGERRLIASEDHRFLACVRPYWRRAVDLRLHTRLVDIGMPLEPPALDDTDYLAGYAAGAICGDGTYRWEPGWRSDKKGFPQSYCRVAVLVEDKPILQRIEAAYLAYDIRHPPIRTFDGGRRGRELIALETRSLESLATIHSAILPERESKAWKSGWLAGLFDTDGCYSGKNLRWAQRKDASVLQRVVQYVAELQFDVKIETHPGGGCPTAILRGSLEDRIHFLSTIQPALRRKCGDFTGRRFPSKSGSVVDGVRRIGIHTLVDIQTRSGTFIAAGIASHNCYAVRMSHRLEQMGQDEYAGVTSVNRRGDRHFNGVIKCHENRLDIPRRWKKPRLVFVNSMSDLFHKDVPFAFIEKVFRVMNECERHTFQILTKRPEIAAEYAARLNWTPNIWMGTSVENMLVTHRIRDLRQIPACVRFLSCEPLLGPLPRLPLRGIHWVIVGGESGPGARPMEKEWVRQIRDRCIAQSVPFFFKQWGGMNKKATGRKLDRRTWEEMPSSIKETNHGVRIGTA